MRSKLKPSGNIQIVLRGSILEVKVVFKVGKSEIGSMNSDADKPGLILAVLFTL